MQNRLAAETVRDNHSFRIRLADQFSDEVNPLGNGRSVRMGYGGQSNLVAASLKHSFEPREPRLLGKPKITVDDEGAFPNHSEARAGPD